MSLTAPASVFVVFLLSVQVIQGQNGWRVTYTSTEICALKGSTVEMRCTYRYPSWLTVQKIFWFTKLKETEPVDLTTDSEYSGRVQYICDNNKCTLRITDLRESDSAEYKFRIITKLPSGKYSGSPGVTLSVTALQVQVKTIQQYYANAELKCHSSCSPAGRLSYVWFRNGQKVREETSSYNGWFHPRDVISCALKGHENYGSPSVYAPKLPSVSVSPSAEIVENSSVTLTCSSDAHPAANYTWYKKNGGPDPQPLSKEAELVFRSIQSSDSGEYYCTAENELRKRRTSESISVNVKYAPKLPSVSVSPSAEIVENSSVTLTCSSDANPAANYTWYKEKQKLPQRSTGIYHFTSISSEDRGNYYCKSENQYGEIDSSSLFIDVQYPPKLPSVSVSPSAEILENSSVTLTCSSDANPAANYTWYKEKQKLPQRSTGIYHFTSISSEDRGNYYCKSENQYGEIDSSSLFIDVQYAPKLPSVSVSPSAEIVENSSVTLTCSSDANPAANYTWYKEKQKLPQRSTGIYHFTSISSEDRGNYYCKSENQYGEIDSSSLFIDVQYAPKLPSVSVSPSSEIVENSSVNLTCSSDANPAANYTWYKEKQKLPQRSTGIYHFTSISSEDRGNYYCKSENQYGEIDSSSLFIDVQYAPKLPSVSVSPSAEIVENSSVNLTCSSDANPAANYTWYKENEDSPKASGQIFTITDFRPEHRGNYYCEAQNRRGRHNSTLHPIVVAGNSTMITMIIDITRWILFFVMLIPLPLVYLWMRKKKTLRSSTEPNEPIETMELDSGLDYINVSALNRVSAAEAEDTEEVEDLV